MKSSAIAIKLPLVVASILLAACALVACGGSSPQAALKDGTYTAQSSVYDGDDQGGSGYGVITLTVKDGKISEAEFLTYEPNGTLKDENYGKTANNNQDFYNKAQKAVAACKQYAADLVAKGSVDNVDVISGATISYKEFQEAADAALAEASK